MLARLCDVYECNSSVKNLSNQYRESWKVNDLISHNAREKDCVNFQMHALRTIHRWHLFDSLFSVHLFDKICCMQQSKMCSKTKYIYQYVICPSHRMYLCIALYKIEVQKRHKTLHTEQNYYECLHLYRLFLHTLRQWVLFLWSSDHNISDQRQQ